MKNWEKFEKIFGFEPSDICILPRDICNGNPPECEECKLNDWWRNEYNNFDKSVRNILDNIKQIVEEETDDDRIFPSIRNNRLFEIIDKEYEKYISEDKNKKICPRCGADITNLYNNNIMKGLRFVNINCPNCDKKEN